MTPSARTYTGIMQIFFGGSTVSGARGQHAVDFPDDFQLSAQLLRFSPNCLIHRLHCVNLPNFGGFFRDFP